MSNKYINYIISQVSTVSSVLYCIPKQYVVISKHTMLYNYKLFIIVPVEVLTLWFNLPWMTVFNDFRHGLLIAGLFFFWTLFIGHLVS